MESTLPRPSAYFWLVKKLSSAKAQGNVLISSRFWALFKYLSLIGYLRISKRREKSSIEDVEKGTSSEKYFTKFISVGSLQTILTQLIQCILSYFVISDLYYTSRFKNWVIALLTCSGFLQSFLLLASSWLRASSSPRLLNGWDKIEIKFLTTFGTPLDKNNLHFVVKLMYCGYFLLPLAVDLCMWLPTCLHWPLPIQKVFSGVTIVTFTIAQTGMQALYFITCYVMATIIDKITAQIQKELKDKHFAILSKIFKWKSLLLLVNEQLQIVNNWLSPFGMVMGLIRIIKLTLSTYITLALLNENYFISSKPEEAKEIYAFTTETALFVCFNGIGLLAMEIYYAEKIRHSNLKLAKVFKTLSTEQFSIEAKFEVKSLIDDLQTGQTKVCYYDIIPVDWKLILGVISCSITYLIVLLQFRPINN